MADYLFKQTETKERLRQFFSSEKPSLSSFGSRVNQTFEAYIFARLIRRYRDVGWKVTIQNPTFYGKKQLRLKFSTRGRPQNYSFVECERDGVRCQIRHQLRVATRADDGSGSANICCDLVIIDDLDLSAFSTFSALPNSNLISFGEVKHMSAYAELIAGFIGMVHELQPDRLQPVRIPSWKTGPHLPPFLSVSGVLYATAKGLRETIVQRQFDLDIYCFDDSFPAAI